MKSCLCSRRFPSKKTAALLGLIMLGNLVQLRAQAEVEPPKLPNFAPRVLYIGDSLSVGAFGELLEQWLIRDFGRSQVAFFASCGSSAEHWLDKEPVFMTHCGYRETTPRKQILESYETVKKPRHMATPKIGDLLKKYRPEIVLIQLGTNHFDNLVKEGLEALPKQEANFEALARAILKSPANLRHVVWILPPDTGKFPEKIEMPIEKAIRRVAEKYHIQVVDSRRLAGRFVPGKTGTDGVHFLREPALKWGSKVAKELKKIFLEPIPTSETEGVVPSA